MPDMKGVAGKTLAEDKTWEFEQYEERIKNLEKLIDDLKTVNNFLGIYEDLRASIRDKANKQPDAKPGNIVIFDEEGDIEDGGLSVGNIKDLIKSDSAVDENGNITIVNILNDLYKNSTYYITQMSEGKNIVTTDGVMKSVIHIDSIKGGINVSYANLKGATETNPIPFNCVGDNGGITLTCTGSDGSVSSVVIPIDIPLGSILIERRDEEDNKITEEIYSEIVYENSTYGYYDRVLNIASYVDEDITTPYISSTGGLHRYARVLYVNPTPTFHAFPDQKIFYTWKSFDGVNTITSSDMAIPELKIDLAYLRPGQLLLDLFAWVSTKIVLGDIPSGESKSVYVGSTNPKDTDYLVWVDPSDNTLKYRTDPDSSIWYTTDSKNAIHIGASAPSLGTPYMIWVDTSTNTIKYRLNNASNSWNLASADIVWIDPGAPATSSGFIVWIDTSQNIVKYRTSTTSANWISASAVWN